MVGRLKWDQSGEKYFETGTKRCVLYPQDASGAYPEGVAWNGMRGFSKKPTGAEKTKLYANDSLYGVLKSAEELEGTLTAYTYPTEWAECDGSVNVLPGIRIGQQKRKTFGLCFRTIIGNDIDDEVGYQLHLIYGGSASPSEKSYQTVGDSPEAIEFSWDISTTPVEVPDFGGESFKPTAEIVIDSRDYATTEGRALLASFEDKLYGVDAVAAKAAVYTATSDATKQAGKTYYTRSGTEGAYEYTAFTGESFADQTTYYELTSAAVEAVTGSAAYLPLPEEVFAHFATA